MAIFGGGETRIYYEESGTGDPVLLLPGWGGTIDELQPLRRALEANWRVIAADLPGSGKSGPQPRTYKRTYYEDDAYVFLAMLDGLAASPAHLVGFSDGGEYALLMAALRPDAVRSVATWGAAGTLGRDPDVVAPFANLIDDPIPPLVDFANYMKATYGEENARVMARSAGQSFLEIIEAGGDISRSRAAAIGCAALLITGERDFLATPSLVAEMAKAIPDGRYLQAPAAGHSVHEEQPQWLIATIAEWLGEQGASGSDTSG